MRTDPYAPFFKSREAAESILYGNNSKVIIKSCGLKCTVVIVHKDKLQNQRKFLKKRNAKTEIFFNFDTIIILLNKNALFFQTNQKSVISPQDF
jgi:hypothetical protein